MAEGRTTLVEDRENVVAGLAYAIARHRVGPTGVNTRSAEDQALADFLYDRFLPEHDKQVKVDLLHWIVDETSYGWAIGTSLRREADRLEGICHQYADCALKEPHTVEDHEEQP